MLIIRKEQTEALLAKVYDDNVELLKEYFRIHDRDRLYGDTETVKAALLKAVMLAGAMRANYVSTAATLYRFLVNVHPKFSEHPVIAQVMLDEDTPPDARPGVLLALGSYEIWRELCAREEYGTL